ncbi:pilus assembly PilX family protein [Ottowia sp. SB7-C50]|uniref:pilus assembly PilX family protein n=1 Tax=Ottowia sp. SB7-C50 TaxID=3081231 RepID=UPI002954A69E|nr:PilX N-terminal domain-containing pilus assembly protein [Ottowia sp. SB7-C50]WOP14943.1 PilX N-terminal domain-containing pilus assembly protein [Ottowia sp. SB7-C50]
MKQHASGAPTLTDGRSRRRSVMRHRPARVRGVSLVIVMLILVIVSMLGVASVQISMMGERGARNDRDMQLAWQGAEAALVDAEIDLSGPNSAGASRTGKQPRFPDSGCYTSQPYRGYCRSVTTGSTKPTWLTIDFADQGSSAPSVALGTFTDRTFNSAGAVDGTGIQPALAPRYIIEKVPDFGNPGGNMITSSYASAARAGAVLNMPYRVTAIGFGPRSDIQAVVQTLYRN